MTYLLFIVIVVLGISNIILWIAIIDLAKDSTITSNSIKTLSDSLDIVNRMATNAINELRKKIK